MGEEGKGRVRAKGEERRGIRVEEDGTGRVRINGCLKVEGLGWEIWRKVSRMGDKVFILLFYS